MRQSCPSKISKTLQRVLVESLSSPLSPALIAAGVKEASSAKSRTRKLENSRASRIKLPLLIFKTPLLVWVIEKKKPAKSLAGREK